MTSHPQALGLTSAEVSERIAEGKFNKLPPRTGKSTWDIVRSNVFTRINAILSVLLIMVLSTGSLINSAFGLLIIVNSAIGIIQELRARKTLESLTIIGEDHPRVWRDGEVREIAQEELVMDDVVALGSGDQIVVDGVVTTTDYLSVDESMLTGESDAVKKDVGDKIYSGSYVVSGSGSYEVTKVGAESYAAKLTEEASRYSLAHSELQAGINRILKVITWVLIPVGLLTIYSQIKNGNTDYNAVVLEITGALVPMVPEGLVLITSTAFALGVIRLGQRQCLVQELPAIEGLARVDTVCADKTGTLTENKIEFERLELCGETPEGDCLGGLAQLAVSDPDPNSTMQAIIESVDLPGQDSRWEIVARQPFTSAKKWSGVSFANGEHWVMGAPDVLAGGSPVGVRAEELGLQGLRILLLARCERQVDDVAGTGKIDPLALIIFNQKIRPDAGATLEFFADQDVEVKVISGDNASSVGAVTTKLGISVGDAIDAREISADAFVDVVESHRVFGRVRPDQKQDMVRALQSRGRTVAMTGDGVNDVLALKDADIGVAMGSGSAATRSVAKIVLLDDKFATLPYVVAEGRRVIGNIERVANLFLTKTIYSAFLAILVIIAAVPFPFQPIHVTITGWFTIGIPAFLLSLPPNNARARGGFVERVMKFAFPAGVIVGSSAFLTYMLVSEWNVPDIHVQESTAALLALIIPSTWVLACIARPWSWWKVALIVLPLVGYGIIFSWSFTQELFRLDSSNNEMMLTGCVVGACAAVLIEGLWWLLNYRAEEKLVLWESAPLWGRGDSA